MIEDKVSLSQLTLSELETRKTDIEKQISFFMQKGNFQSVYDLNVMLSYVEGELRRRLQKSPDNIKDLYYTKWGNLECCYLSDYHNLGAAWPAFGRTLATMPKQIIAVPYDKIRFSDEYWNFSLDDHLAYANSTGKFVIIDKTVEHQHDESDYIELHKKLKEHSLLSKCVVYDNTFTSKKYDEYGIPHAYAPWYIWFYIKFLKMPKYVGNPTHQFLCLNNYHKPHRLAIIKALHDKNLIKRTQWSYREHANDFYRVDELLPEFDKENLGFDTPKFIDQSEGNFNQAMNIESFHADALCSIVNETDYFYDGTQFATEKSLNAIYFSSIPIVVSCAGTVFNMREHGIDVYDDIIDHSYDEIENPQQRFDKILKVIEQCASWRDYRALRTQIAPRILRNQILMTHSQHWQDEIDTYTEKFFRKNS